MMSRVSINSLVECSIEPFLKVNESAVTPGHARYGGPTPFRSINPARTAMSLAADPRASDPTWS
jgi:hypothetical protein